MAFFGVDREEEMRHGGLLEKIYQRGLFLGVEAIILVDAENEILLPCLARAPEQGDAP